MGNPRLNSNKRVRIGFERDPAEVQKAAEVIENAIHEALLAAVSQRFGEMPTVASLMERAELKAAEAKKILLRQDWCFPLRLETLFKVCEKLNIEPTLWFDTIPLVAKIADEMLKVMAMRLRYGRAVREWSMEDLAYQSGLSAPTLQKVVNKMGTSPLVSLRQLCVTAEALSVPIGMSFRVVG